MIQSNGNNHTSQRTLNDIGRIRSSSQSGFNNGIIHFFFIKIVNHNIKVNLKHVQLPFFPQICTKITLFQEKLITDPLMIDCNSILMGNQMRRSKHARFVSRFNQTITQKITGTSFTVSSCNMNNF